MRVFGIRALEEHVICYDYHELLIQMVLSFLIRLYSTRTCYGGSSVLDTKIGCDKMRRRGYEAYRSELRKHFSEL